MTPLRPIRSLILGVGACAPDTVVTNDNLAEKVETSDLWIRERTGIRERRIASPGESTADLALKSARLALQDANIEPSGLDGIIVATATPDMTFPSTACLVQAGLGIPGTFAFDVNAVCSGFMYALKVADSMVRSGQCETLLVIGAEVMSRFIDWTDRSTCILFGDGAGAVVLGRSDHEGEAGVGTIKLHADGRFWDLIHVPGGGSRQPVIAGKPAGNECTIRMKGAETFKMAVRTLEESVREVLKEEGIGVSEVDWVVPHQANIRILDALSDRLEIPLERFVVNIDRYGNTSAASIPMALDEAVRDKRIRPGHRLLLTAFGSGVTWGSGIVTWKGHPGGSVGR
ncbi:MAG: beta-ketoacyl-ACP synthase III [Leptospirillum sp.]